jgi:hypothetical protein
MQFRTILAAIAISAPLALTGVAHAADAGVTYSGEVGYTYLGTTDSPHVNISAIDVRGGAQFTEHFGAEVEGVFGVTKDNVGGGVKAGLDYLVGAYAVGSVPAGEGSAFARVGVVDGKVKVSGSGGSASDSHGGWAGGVGYKWFPKGGANGVRVEYTYYDLDIVKANSASISYVHKF